MKYPAIFSLFLIIYASGCSFTEERTLRRSLREEMTTPRPHFIQILRGREVEVEPRTLPELPSLEDYLAFASLNNPGLESAFYRWEAALEKAPQARALPDPKIGINRSLREVETREMPQMARLGVSQMVPWPTKLLNQSDMAVREALSQKYLYDAEKLYLYFKVRKAYYEYYYLYRSVQTMKESLSLLQNMEASLQARYEGSSATNPALLRLQLELGRQEERLKSLEALRPVLVSQLKAAIGSSSASELPWPQEKPSEMPALDEEQLLASLQEDNPGLNAARAKIQASRSGERLARAGFLPDFEVMASYVETERMPGVMKDSGKDPVMLSLEMTMPLWMNKNAAAVREARAIRMAEESALKEQSNQLTADLRLAFFNYGDAARKSNLFAKTLVPKAEESLEASRTAFSAGKAEFSELLEAERTLLELRLMAERSEVDQEISLAELEMLSARELRQESKTADE